MHLQIPKLEWLSRLSPEIITPTKDVGGYLFLRNGPGARQRSLEKFKGSSSGKSCRWNSALHQDAGIKFTHVPAVELKHLVEWLDSKLPYEIGTLSGQFGPDP